MRGLTLRMAEPFVAFPAVFVLLLAVVWGATLHMLDVEKELALAKTARSSAELLETYDAQMLRSLGAINQTLRTVQYAFHHAGPHRLLSDLSENQLLPPPLFFAISLIDSQGKVTAGARAAAATSVADHAFFLAHVQGDSETTLITPPQQVAEGKWRIRFSRRLDAADGSFGGVVALSVEPSHFTDAYDEARLGRRGVLALLGADGSYFARRSGAQVSWGEPSGVAVNQSGSKAQAGPAMSLPGLQDGEALHVRARALHGFPLALMVGLSESEQLAPYMHARRGYLLKAAVASVLLLVIFCVTGTLSWQLNSSRRRSRKAQETYYAALNASQDAFYVLRLVRGSDGDIKDFVVEDTNSRGAALFGVAPAEMYGRSLCAEYPESLRNGVFDEFASAARNMSVDEQEWENTNPAVDAAWLQRQLVPVQDGLVLIVRDISERKRAETLRLLQARVLEAIAKGTPLREVLQELLLLIRSQLPDVICSILLLDDEGQRLRHGAAIGLPQDYIDAVDGIQIGPRSGSCGTAVFRGEPVIVSDILSDPLWEDRRDLAAAHGLRSCWSAPILSHRNRVLGSFAIYSREVQRPSALEQQMVEIASRIGSIAIERQQTEDRIWHLAYHDPLTGLPNRSLLEDRVGQAIAHARGHGRQVTVALIDLDNFKVINDSLGHKAGDELLKAVACRMAQSVRGTDTVIRLGGDEFVVVLADQPRSPKAAALPLQKIHDAIAQPLLLSGREVQATCSIGLASYPADGEDLQTLLMNADTAMYRAKELGRNNFQFYTSDMHKQMEEKLTLQEGMRKALARGEFFLLYQPQVELSRGRMIGFEALIRWQHPKLGIVSPDRFIPLAEESGLIVDIGDWVLRSACAQNKAWQDAGLPPCVMSVNVSAKQFRDGCMTARVNAALAATGLNPRYLGLELTESLLMQDQDHAVAVMHELRAIGVQLAIDDFGTGYSSLSALKRFPIASLKLDRSFVKDLPDDEDDKAIARAVISLGHQLDMRIVAEGVETVRQLAFLQESGCDEIQGYYFSRPLPASAAARMFFRARRLLADEAAV